MNCRKIGLSGCQALGLVFHMKNDPFFFGQIASIEGLHQGFCFAFSCLICLGVFQEVSAVGRCLEICVVQGLVCQIFFSDGGCHEKQQ